MSVRSRPRRADRFPAAGEETIGRRFEAEADPYAKENSDILYI